MNESGSSTRNGRPTVVSETDTSGVYRFGDRRRLLHVDRDDSGSYRMSVIDLTAPEGTGKSPSADDSGDDGSDDDSGDDGSGGGTQRKVVDDLSVFQNEQQDACTVSWYADDEYMHRYEGASITFETSPSELDEKRLRAVVEGILEILTRQTHLGGHGILPPTDQFLADVTSHIVDLDAETVTVGGWDTDRFGQFGSMALLRFGVGSGSETAPEDMRLVRGNVYTHLKPATW